MKRERIQFLVTISIRHDGTPQDRREIISDARFNVMAVSSGHEAKPIRATLVKKAK